MEKFFVVCVLVLSLCPLHAQSLNDLILNGGNGETSLHLKNGSSELMPFLSGLPEDIVSTYTHEYISGIALITINEPKPIKLALLYNQEFGIVTFFSPIINETIILQQFVNNKTEYPRKNKQDIYIEQSTNYKVSASSSLKENNIIYGPDNLKKSIIDGPWVEGVAGDGLGENITFEFQNDSKVNALLISNGFVSYEKPELFLKNNRVKKILIESNDGSLKQEYTLLDTAALQTIRFNQFVTKLKITILEVYKGSNWDDTCINMIIGLHL